MSTIRNGSTPRYGFSSYKDTGCERAPSCLERHFTFCQYDYQEQILRVIREERLSVNEAAQRFEISAAWVDETI